jgi:hypothetical protein
MFDSAFFIFAMAAYYDVPKRYLLYSGGTEATALFSSVVFALEKHGFKSNLIKCQ